MRLTLVIFSLRGGGAERVMTIMANYWAADNHKVTLLTLDDDSATPDYELDRRIRYVALGVADKSENPASALRKNVARIRVLRRAISDTRPDAVLSFMDRTNVLTLLATRGLGVPVVVSERSDPKMNFPGRFWSQLRLLTYPMATSVVVQSKGAFEYFPQKVKTRARIIPNPVLMPVLSPSTSTPKLPYPLIVAMGRLVRVKGFDLLIQAFAKLKDKHPEWSLVILGEGPLRQELESLVDEVGLDGRVALPGRFTNPHDLLSAADLFVMSSRFEGFPNALCEAMAAGLPVISTDCPSGPREIICDGVDGLLVPNEDPSALVAAMDRLMANRSERARLASSALEVTERFSLNKVMAMWEAAFGVGGRERSVEPIGVRELT